MQNVQFFPMKPLHKVIDTLYLKLTSKQDAIIRFVVN